MRWATSLAVFLVAALAPRIWRAVRARRWGIPVTVTVDPGQTGPKEMAAYLAEIAQRLDEAPAHLRIRFRLVDPEEGEARGATASYVLDVRPDGRLEIRVPGRRPHVFDLRGRWLPEHAVPIELCAEGKSTVLYAAPTDSNRFRVMDRLPAPRLVGAPVLLSLVATCGVVGLVPECLAFALGGAAALVGNSLTPGRGASARSTSA